MVRQADYIYGVVPKRGEYGFESKPAEDDPAVLSRVQSITSSFQWSAAASNDAEAIAVDRTDPPLVIRIVTDPRDPAGRRSVCMQIWIASENESVATMIAELWPRTVALPISQDEFLAATGKEASGRIVVGPDNSFTAVGFDQSWGTRATTHHPASRPSSRLIARENETASTRNLHNSKGSSIMLRVFATFSVIALLATAGFAVTQYWEVERLQLEVKKLARDGKEAAEKKDLIKQQLEVVKKENEKKAIEVETQSRELVQLRSDAERLKNRIAELDSVVAANPEKVAKAELLALRSLKAAVEKHIDSQNHSLRVLADSVPQPPSRFEEFADKFQGKNNNE